MGIVDSAVRCDVLLSAWRVCLEDDAEAAENAERKAKGLPPLPKPKQRKGVQPGMIQITVSGQKRTVPLPPPGAFYDGSGNLVQPEQRARRF